MDGRIVFSIIPAETGIRPDENYQLTDDEPIKTWIIKLAKSALEKQLNGQCRTALQPGGRLAIYDVIAGPGGEVYFPIPWARDPSISFLVTNEKLRHFLDQAGFTIISWRDTTEAGLAWFREKSAQIREHGRSAVGYHILLGEDFPQMARNQLRSLNENRMALLQVIAERPAK